MSEGDVLRSLPIVARRWRVWVSLCLLLLSGGGSLWRALQEPSIGFRFAMNSVGPLKAESTRGGGDLVGVMDIEAGGRRQALSASVLTETAGVINLYVEQDRFYADHRVIWNLLQHAKSTGGVVHLRHDGGVMEVHALSKTWAELGPRFWFPWTVGLLCFSVGLAVWSYSPRRDMAWWFMVASAGYAYVMLITAPIGSRLLTQNIAGWQVMQMGTHLAGFVMLSGVAQLLWNHPTRLGGSWSGWALVAYAAVSLGIDWSASVDSISIGFRLPIALFGILLMGLTWMQWRSSAGDPGKRAQVRWLSFLFVCGFSLLFVAYLVGVVGESVRTPQVYGMAWNALFFLGLVPLVTRVGLFQLEDWWVRAWLWFVGGLLVLMLDVALISLFSMPAPNALVIATAVTGWAYFPVRQWLWQRLAGARGMDAQTLLPDILKLVQGGGRGSPSQVGEWKALWERCFEPARMVELGRPRDDVLPEVSLIHEGAALCVPSLAGLPGLRLEHVSRGRRLFGPRDATLAQEIIQLVQAGLESTWSYERGAREERHRVASDLHDDLGAILLSITQSPTVERSTELARLAMDDLRLSVRGLAGDEMPLQDMVADWRPETVARVQGAGMVCTWEADSLDRSEDKVPSSVRMQLARVLREAVSNVIRHSGATSCRIQFELLQGELCMQVSDDGCGMSPEVLARSRGHGLAGMERRVRGMGGRMELRRGQTPNSASGTRLTVAVPLTFLSHENRPDR